MSLACRQTGVFRHCWISHEQDDSVHSRALDVVRERDRFFGGLGLHPLVESQSGDDEFDHAACVVTGVVVRADTEIANAKEQF